jgi:cytochrome bd ubiquinol oxidase subunit II
MVLFWISVLALSILLYVLLDGSDLGVGILFGFARGRETRSAMLASVEPAWDGNETWLVVAGVVLWGAFPAVYSTLLSAFYLPIILMLAGLILRGVAFEFRDKARRLPWVWDVAFAGGSLVAGFMQGLMVGALAAGLPLRDGQYSGGELGWLKPFPVLCGAGLCLAYALLGACWLVSRCEGASRSDAYRMIPRLAGGLALVLIAVLATALATQLPVLDRWVERPYLFVFPGIGVAAAIVLALGTHRRWTFAPGYAVVATFLAAFATFALSFWPYIVPFSITVEQAAAPHASLAFMFWGEGLFVLPLMLGYTLISYRVFRGKSSPGRLHY